MATPAPSHASYLAAVPEPSRAALEKLRRAIQSAVPEAEEGFSYGLPAFRIHGKPLAGFAATANHCAFYPMSGSVITLFARELAGFETSRGTIRFQPDHPIPASLLKQLLKARMAEIAGPKAAATNRPATRKPAARGAARRPKA